jgi:hypothetical protein
MNLDLRQRLAIFEANIGMIDHVLSQAKDLDGQALIICDVRDRVGGRLSRALAEKAGTTADMDAHRTRLDAKGQAFQTTIAVLPIEAVRLAIQDSNPSVALALGRPVPAGAVYAVIIAAGGTTLLAPPRPARGPIPGQG